MTENRHTTVNLNSSFTLCKTENEDNLNEQFETVRKELELHFNRVKEDSQNLEFRIDITTAYLAK